MSRKVNYQDLTPDQKGLLQSALVISDRASCDYSEFRVGAALLVLNDKNEAFKIINGVNVENVSYPVCTCSERVAIGTFTTEGHTRASMMAIIANPKGGPYEEILSPCGMCRQAIMDLANRCGIDIEVIMSNTAMTKIEIWKISELLPLAFDAKHLKK
jgi:cytidine deaminase